MTAEPIRFNPYEPGFAADPYAQYRALREHDPVHKSFMGTWVLTRYQDVLGVLHNANFSSELRHWNGFGRRYRNREAVAWLLDRSVLNLDPPLHTQLRKALTRAFGPADRPRLAAVVEDVVAGRIEELKAAGSEFDAISDFAVPVPVRVVSHIYRVAVEDMVEVKRWSVDVSALIEPLPTGSGLEDAEVSIARFKDYLRARLDDPAGPDSLPGRMAACLERGEIGEDHALANLILMFPAGHETTVNLIGNGILTLLRHPEQMQLLRRRPELIERAIEEILRFEPPQQVAWRSVLEDCSIGGKHLRKGDQVMMLLGAANRDPEVFADPERFDIARESNPHLAFGSGRHGCLGSWFARMQGAIALSALLAAFPELRPRRRRPRWHPTLSFHGLSSLPVRA